MNAQQMVTVGLLVILGILALIFLVAFVKDLLAHKDSMEKESNTAVSSAIGFGINFFDVFGIGSFAPGASLYKGLKQVDDKLIPGTLNVACTIPVVMEAFLFIQGVEVEPITLVTMILAAMVGAWIGAGIISKLSKQMIQLVMGVAMVVIGFVIIL